MQVAKSMQSMVVEQQICMYWTKKDCYIKLNRLIWILYWLVAYVGNINKLCWKQLLFYLTTVIGIPEYSETVIQLKSTNICLRCVKRFRFPEGTIITSGTVHTCHGGKGFIRTESSGMRTASRGNTHNKSHPGHASRNMLERKLAERDTAESFHLDEPFITRVDLHLHCNGRG